MNTHKVSIAPARPKEYCLFSQLDFTVEESGEQSDIINEQISTNRKTSSNLHNQNDINHQNNRITRETITDDLYRYTWEPTKNVWIVGTDDSATNANAVLLGYANCPVGIEIAREKTHTDGKSYPVEIIGQRAFLWLCFFFKLSNKDNICDETGQALQRSRIW